MNTQQQDIGSICGLVSTKESVNKELIAELVSDLSEKYSAYQSIEGTTAAADCVRQKYGIEIGLMTTRLTTALGLNPTLAGSYSVLDEKRNLNEDYLSLVMGASNYFLQPDMK